MSQRYPILRSGFLTFPTSGLKQPDTPFDDTAAALLGKTHLAPNDDHFFHENIQKLYVKTVKNAQLNILTDITMQEHIVRAAAEAFGTKDFFAWINLQLKNPHLTSVHQKFLIETLNYLKGAPRQMHVAQWHRLLEMGTSEDRTTIRPNNFTRELEAIFKDKSLPHNLSEVLVRWIRQEGGWFDLIESLEAIFGNRRTQTGYLG